MTKAKSSICQSSPSSGTSKDVCKYCNKTFHFADATVKGDHSLCWSMPKNEIQIKNKETHSKNGDTPAELPDVSIRKSPSIEKQLSETKRKNLSTPSTSASSPVFSSANTSTSISTNIQKCTKNNIPVQLKVCFGGDKQTDQLHELLARTIYATGIPMDMTENYHWKEFLKAIRPSYIPPTANDLRSNLLKMEYNRIMTASQQKIQKAFSLSLITYGWANPKGEIHFIVTTPEPLYLKCILTLSEKDKACFSQQIMKIIEKIGGEKLMLLLTDNESNLKETLNILAETYSYLSVSGFAANDMKLLLKDIIKAPSVQDFLKKAKEMLLSINLTDVRCGAISTLKTLLENKSTFQVDIALDEMIPEEVKRDILDADLEFWTEVQILLDLLIYISEAIKTLEADRTLLSDVPMVLADIQTKVFEWMKSSSFSDEEKYTISQLAKMRNKSALKPIHNAANLLDPRYRGLKLDVNDFAGAVDFLRKKCYHFELNEQSIMTNLNDYVNSLGFYSKSYLWGTAKHLSPQDWWFNFCSNQPLFRLAMQLLSVFPSSTAYQRIFKGIEMNPNHELNLKALEKLITIKSNLLFSKKLK